MKGLKTVLFFKWCKFISLSLSPQSFETDGRSKDSDCGQIQRAASAITDALSKRHNTTVLQAVVEAKVEVKVECPSVGEC